MKSNFMRKPSTQGILMILPNTIGLAVFYIIPIIISIVLGLFEWDGFSSASFIGFENFSKLIKDELFLNSIKNTFIYTLTVVPCIVILSVVLSTLLESTKQGFSKTLRFIYLLPMMTMPTAAAVIWKWILNTNYGVLNCFLANFGIEKISWLATQEHILTSISIIGTWIGFSTSFIIISAGLKGIPNVYYEAAEIDGATKLRQFFTVTLPMITPSIFFIIVNQLIICFQVFDTVLVILGAAPSGVLKKAGNSMVMTIYQNGFIHFKMGYSSAQAFILFLIILLITIIQFKGQKKWVNYD